MKDSVFEVIDEIEHRQISGLAAAQRLHRELDGIQRAHRQGFVDRWFWGFWAAIQEERRPAILIELGHAFAAGAAARDDAGDERRALVAVAKRLKELGAEVEAADAYARARATCGPHDVELATYLATRRLGVLCDASRNEQVVAESPVEVELARAGHLPAFEATLTLIRGRSLSNLGRHTEALEALSLAVGLRRALSSRETDDIPDVGFFELQLGLAARLAGRQTQALAALRDAYRSYSEADQSKTAAVVLSEIGITLQQFHENESARTVLSEAVEAARRLGMSAEAERWNWDALGTGTGGSAHDKLVRAPRLLDAHHNQEALGNVLDVLESKEARNDDLLQCDARNVLAAAYEALHQLPQAVAAAKVAVAMAARRRDGPRELRHRTNLAALFRHSRRFDESEREIERTVALGERLREEATTTEERRAIATLLAPAYDERAALLAAWIAAKGGKVERRGDRLLHLAQQSCARNLCGWLAAEREVEDMRAPVLLGVLSALRAADLKIESAIFDSDSILTPLLTVRAEAAERLRLVAAEHGRSLSFEPPSVNAADLMRGLHVDDCLIELFASGGSILLCGVGTDANVEVSVIQWGRSDRLSFVRRWEKAIGSGKGDRSSRFTPQRSAVRGGYSSRDFGGERIRQESVTTLLRELQERLMKPLAEFVRKLGGRRAVIVPHRELAVLPFAMLAKDLSGIRVSLLPSAAVATLLPVRPSGGPQLVLPDVTGTLECSTLDTKGLSATVLSPANAEEALRLMSVAGSLHFAGHGIFDSSNPYRSGLVIAPMTGDEDAAIDKTRIGENVYQLLTVGTLASAGNLPACRLVVLAACSSGLPRTNPSSEFVGLPAAFLIAGARNVVAALWPVDDRATALLMQQFYLALDVLKSPSLALERARARLAEMSREEAEELLGAPAPPGETPFGSPQHLLSFQHYGID
jgi:tetratricopeptide (TPR) repeat protein